MADTIPDVKLKGKEYEDIYSLTGITQGTSVTIQNKSWGALYIQVSSTAPDSTSKDGYLLTPTSTCLVDNSPSGIWAKGNCTICVQENDS